MTTPISFLLLATVLPGAAGRWSPEGEHNEEAEERRRADAGSAEDDKLCHALARPPEFIVAPRDYAGAAEHDDAAAFAALCLQAHLSHVATPIVARDGGLDGHDASAGAGAGAEHESVDAERGAQEPARRCAT